MKNFVSAGVAGAVFWVGFVLSAPAEAVDMAAWQQSLVRKIQASHIYPRSAIRKEIEGVARVRITIDRSGAVKAYEVLESAGSAVLDKTIPKMVERLDPLPEPPSDLADENLTFTIPFAWRLN